MPSHALEALVEERVAQLDAMSLRRNEMLREMYHLMRRRQNVGSIFALEEEDKEELDAFLERFDLRKHPGTGTIDNLLLTEPAGDLLSIEEPLSKEVVEERSPNDISDEKEAESRSLNILQIEEMPMEEMPVEETPVEETPVEETPVEETPVEEMPMDVDAESSPFPSPKHTRRSRSRHQEDSDDLLELVPPDGEPARTVSPSFPPQHGPEDEDDRDELDLIGSLSPSPPASSTTSSQRRTQTQVTPQPRSTKSPTWEPSSTQSDVHRIFDTPEPADAIDGERRAADSPLPELEVDALPEVLPQSAPEPEPSVRRVDDDSMTLEYPTPTPDVPSSPVRHKPKVPYIPTAFDAPPPQPSRLIPTPSSPIQDVPIYNFDDGAEPETDTKPLQHTISPTQIHHHFSPHYSLPPLKALPVEFNRKGKPTKQQRKREKEREKNERGVDNGDRKKDDWVPMGVNKWAATLHANPVYKKVARASNCLSTRDWSVAITELRLIRTLERIETLKDTGKWSFRQPKKQRGVGGLIKTHWDYVMDEMRWMRLDFREERKWKIALAYNLSTAVLEWHAAGSLEERVRRRICVLWKRPRADPDAEEDVTEDVEMNVDQEPVEQATSNPLPMVDYGSDNDDDDEEEQEQTQQDIVDSLDALDSAGQNGPDESQESTTAQERVEPKIEDIEDSSALRHDAANVGEISMDVDTMQDSSTTDDKKSKEEESLSLFGLKTMSTDPILGSGSGSTSHSQSVIVDTETSSSSIKSVSKLYAPLRERIVYSDDQKLFLDLDDFDLAQGISELSTDDKGPEVHLPSPDLSTIFPDLQPLGLLDVAPAVLSGSLTEGKKKSEKKSEKDDPNKRAEDTTYTKLAPIGKFMHCKPTLLGPLRPAKRWKNGQWSNLEETAIIAETDIPSSRLPDDTICALFEGNKPGNSPLVNTPVLPTPPKDARKRSAELLWTPQDDNLLKSAVERYPNNWPLIAEAFNASRVTISIDKRTPWDCLERWNQRWCPSNRLGAQGVLPDQSSPSIPDGSTPPPAVIAPAQMTTRGVKRLASASVSSGNTSSGSSGDPRKRRHTLMYDAIRKLAKKKEAAQKSSSNQRKPPAVHDTHGQYNKLPKYSPAELSRIKAEREAKEAFEMMQARKQHEDLARKQPFGRGPVVQNMPQQAQLLQQQQPNGIPRPAATSLPPPQGVPQIRGQVNISQQQRIPTPLAAASARLSPQQMLQVQAQAAHARAMAAQAQVQNTSNISGVGNGMSNSHLSPPYASRADTSSPAIPQGSPPQSSATPSNANPSRPPSASAIPQSQQQGMQPSPQVPGNAPPRPATNIGHFFPSVSNIQGAQFTLEQVEQARRLQTLIQAQQRQAGISQAPQNGSYPPT